MMAKEISELDVHHLFSSNIKRLRQRENLSQFMLAQKVGLTHNFINDIENNKKGVSAKTLAKLSNALNAEPYQFYLPEIMYNNEMGPYVKDFNDNFVKFVAEISQKYFTNSEEE